MYLYIVDYWVPFPQSEYGGVINVIAENDGHCHSLLIGEESFQHEGFNDRIMEAIVRSQKLKLSDDYQPGIIEAFVT